MRIPRMTAGLLLAAAVVPACEETGAPDGLVEAAVEDTTTTPGQEWEDAEIVDDADGEGTVRPIGADIIADDDHIVAVLQVQSEVPGALYTYKFMATEDGTSGVVAQGDFSLPQPVDDDICPLHTFLKVANEDEVVPSLLLSSCASQMAEFARDDVPVGAEVVRVGDLRNEKTGAVEYDVLYRSTYCTGGDGGKAAFESQRCADISARVMNTDGPGVGWYDCAIYTMAGANGTCQAPNERQRRAICDSHVTGGWLQRTSSLTIFPDGCYNTFTTKTRWQVAACVQPLEIKWKARNSVYDSMPSAWTHFTNVSPNNWATMTLYAGTVSSNYLCSGGNCWNNRDYRVAIDQASGDGRFRAANGWATMQGKATSSHCTLDL